jgi:hypothetical protein
LRLGGLGKPHACEGVPTALFWITWHGENSF